MNIDLLFPVEATIQPVSPRPAILRMLLMLLAILIGFSVLTILLGVLSVQSLTLMADYNAGLFPAGTVSQSAYYLNLTETANGETTVSLTKTIDPPNPDTGGIVTVCFTISGLGPQRLDVVMAQDVSGSMDEPAEEGETQTRLEASKTAAIAFADELQDTDRAAVVPYSSTTYVAQPLTTTRSSIVETIDGLVAGGYTNIGEGIEISREELMNPEHYMSETVKAMILLSDGNANCDEDGCSEDEDRTAEAAEYALEQAKAAADGDIKIYTVGFGADTNTELLETIAITTGGKYYFAPDGSDLEDTYLEIALELHNLVITDILPSGIETDCSQWPPSLCIEDPTGVTTVTFPISDSLLISDPLGLCFTTTVDWDPNCEGPINVDGSGICYQDADEQTICDEFVNPPIVVGGRKIMGNVFHDLNSNGLRDEGEEGASDVIVQTSIGLTYTTSASGSYVLRTSSEPAISVSIASPPGYVSTTPISQSIPSGTGIYTVDFGIYGGVCVRGKVFNDINFQPQDIFGGVAGATVVASGGTSVTTGDSGVFVICAPASTGPITVTEIDPAGYTSTRACDCAGVRIIDPNTLRIDSPSAGNIYGRYSWNAFGDRRLPNQPSIYLPIILKD